MNIQWRPWQRKAWELIRTQQEMAIVGYRGCGKDFLLQIFALGALDRGDDVVILNLSERQNKKWVRHLKKLVKSLQKEGIDFPLGEDSVLEVGHRRTGAVLTALTSKATNLQGYHCHILLNELGANTEDTEEVVSQAQSCVATNPEHRLIICSNATEPGHWLDMMLHDEDERWQEWRADLNPIVHRIQDDYPDKLPDRLARLKRKMTPTQWGKWFECRFTGDGGSVLGRDTLAYITGVPGGEVSRVVAGFDIGTARHPSSAVVLGKLKVPTEGDQWVVMHSESRWGMALSDQPEWIRSVCSQFNVHRYTVDRGGIGFSIVQGLQRAGDLRLDPVSYSPSFYASNTEKLRSLASTRALLIPPEFQELRKQLQQASVDDKGRVTKPEGTLEGNTTHCDELDALLGAVHLADISRSVSLDELLGSGGTAEIDFGPGLAGWP